MMYRLLIVDDEEIIADSLYYYFLRQKELEIDIYKAYSAKEALDILYKVRFDIVISDISMPEINGLELLDTIKKYWPFCRVVLLTGHQDFGYAYDALKYNGIRYVLKTEGYDRLLEVINEMISELDQTIQQEEMVGKLNQRISELIPVYQRQWMEQVFNSEFYHIKQSELDEMNIRMSAQLPVLLLAARLDKSEKKRSFQEINKLFSVVDIIISRCLENFPVESMMYVERQNAVWIFQNSNKGEDIVQNMDLQVYLGNMLESIQRECKDKIVSEISFALSHGFVEWHEIPGKYRSTRSMLNYSIGHRPGVIIEEKWNIQESDTRQPSVIKGRVVNLQQLLSYFENGDRERFQKLLTQDTQWMQGLIEMENMQAIDAYISVTSMLISCINQWELPGDLCNAGMWANLVHLEQYASWIEAVDRLREVADIVFLWQENSGKKDAIWIIELVKEYIQSHIAEDLSLVCLADYVHLNPYYLSRLFKEDTGINLKDYIHNARLNKAKELLRNSMIKVQDIAKEAGFGSAKYFSTVFRGKLGITPQEWRECNSSIQNRLKSIYPDNGDA